MNSTDLANKYKALDLSRKLGLCELALEDSPFLNTILNYADKHDVNDFLDTVFVSGISPTTAITAKARKLSSEAIKDGLSIGSLKRYAKSAGASDDESELQAYAMRETISDLGRILDFVRQELPKLA